MVDAYALIGDVPGLAEKIQSFFMQEVLSESHSALKTILQEARIFFNRIYHLIASYAVSINLIARKQFMVNL